MKRSGRSVKPFIQALFFTAFIALLYEARWPFEQNLPVGFFLHSDPVFVMTASLASGVFKTAAFLSLLTVVSAMIFGRVYCGYACPAGAILDLLGYLKAHNVFKRKGFVPRGSAGAKRLKYLVLAVVTVSAAFGVQAAFVADHMAILGRIGSQVVLALTTGSGAGPLVSASAFFIVMIAMSFAARRGWCRYLCPNGALLALLSVRPPWRRRVVTSCDACGACAVTCPSGCIHEDGVSCNHMECIACKSCQRVCPKNAVSFSFGNDRKKPFETSGWTPVTRREMLLSIVSGAAVAAAGGIEIGSSPIKEINVVRPPGAAPERDFLAACARCGLCARACVTGTIRPAMLESGVAGFMSPVMTPRKAGCEQYCTMCGAVCPTGALRVVDIREKRWARVGTAHIDKQRCLSWNQGLNCLVCHEQCPNTAVRMVERTGDGEEVVSGEVENAPEVDPGRCNGCGQCEASCPVDGTSAIVVTAEGELRLLSGSYIEAARSMGLDVDGTQDFDGGVPDGFVR